MLPLVNNFALMRTAIWKGFNRKSEHLKDSRKVALAACGSNPCVCMMVHGGDAFFTSSGTDQPTEGDGKAAEAGGPGNRCPEPEALPRTRH
jgi:hypothetical protein